MVMTGQPKGLQYQPIMSTSGKAESEALTSPESTPAKGGSKKMEIEKRREKKRKNNAFKTFLNKVEDEPLLETPKRRLSGDNVEEERLSSYTYCKICKVDNPLRSRECEFCKESVCPQHFRKKRRNPETNKFCRICEGCEDEYLYKRHLKNEMKTDESMSTQELLMEDKIKELKGVVLGKRTKLGVIRHRRAEINEVLKRQNAKLAAMEAENAKILKRIEKAELLNAQLQKICEQISRGKPPSMQNDYDYLKGENDRITRDLVKYQKMCHDVVLARSQKEKQMYEEYYEWEQEKRKLRQAQKQKDDQCTIY